MKRTILPICAFAILSFCLCVSLPVSAQVTTGEVTGLVTDSSGAAVPGATVAAECPETKQTYTATTSEAGEYRIAQMAVCVYKVSASAQGFKTSLRDVTVSIALLTKADFQLQIGQKTETITVESAAPLIEYTDQLNNYVDQQRINDLPFNGRDFNSMLGIMPGVQRAPGGGFIAVSINGARTTSNNYLIDGMYNNDRYYGDSAIGQTGVLGVPATVLPNDAVAEFTVQQLPSAEYGVKGGASINVSLKSGTNDIHGGAYYFGHTDATDASNTFTHVVTPLKNHQYGANIGGPILKDKLFYYGFFEGQRNSSLAPYTLNVPTPAQVAAAQANATSICNAGSGGACTTLPGAALVKFFPTDPSGNKAFNIPNTAKLWEFLTKIDYKLSDKHQLSAKYFFGDSFQSAPSAGYTLAPPSGSGLGPDGFNSVAPSRAQLAGASWTFTISPSKILVSRFGFTRFSQIIDVATKIDPRTLGVNTGPLDAADFGVPYVYGSYISYGYIGGVAGYPITTRPDQTYDVSENFTWIKGSHTMKMGGNWQYAFTDSLRNRARSSLVFDQDPDTVNQLTQLYLLRFDRATRSFGSTQRHLYQHSLGVFFSDEWKVKPRVTVTLGLRWEVNSPLADSDRQGGNFIPGKGLLSVGPQLKRIYDFDLGDFGPRAGLAWDVFGNGKTALRFGYALTYDVPTIATIHAPQNASMNGSRSGVFTNPNQGDFSVRVTGNFISSISAANLNSCFDPVTNTSGEFICGAQGPGLATVTPLYGASPTGTPPFNIYSIRPDLKTPRTQYFQMSVQQQVAKDNVLTLAYVGTFGQRLFMIRDLNARHIGCYDSVNGVNFTTPAGVGGNTSGLDCTRPFDSIVDPISGVPEFKSIGNLTNDGKSFYHSLQASFRQQNWHGLNTQYSLTWSHCIDWNSANRGSVRSGFTPFQNPYNPRANQGNCDHDVPLNFNVGGVYSVPKVEALHRLGEGWEIGAVFTALSGRPFTAGVSSRFDHSGQDVNSVMRADCLLPVKYNTRDYLHYVANASVAFGLPADNTAGNCGRNTLRGPGLAQLDVNIAKKTRITERLGVEFRAEAYNVLNRANFANIFASGNSQSGGFQRITTSPDSSNPGIAQGGPRTMQFVVKFTF
ncbi:MAG: TonB-dependent receptor [Acidipila sp.]|nr:TonB-dependent receptor [Acidipila sp.]